MCRATYPRVWTQNPCRSPSRTKSGGSCRDSPRRPSPPFALKPALEEPGLNLPLALTPGHLHELTSKVTSRELVHLVVFHPVATRPHNPACVRIEEGAIVWVSRERVTPDDPRRVIRVPEEKPIGVSLQPQRLHAPHTGQRGLAAD